MSDGGTGEDARYVASPAEAVAIATPLVRARDWKTLANYYDLAGSATGRDELESGRFFEGEGLADDAVQHPFPLDFQYTGHRDLEEGLALVDVEREIDEGCGRVRRERASFLMREHSAGWQFVPEPAPSRAHSSAGIWVCPNCSKPYDVAPKWCPCEPYPTDAPYTIYFVAQVVGADQRASDPGGMDREALQDILIVDARTGFEVYAEGPSADKPAELGPLLRWYFDNRPTRERAAGGETGWVLVRESFEPHVESLDHHAWSVIDVSAREYRRLLELYERDTRTATPS